MTVHIVWDECGNIEPRKVFFQDEFYYVDRVYSQGKGASERAGGFGLRFKVQLTADSSEKTGVTYIFFEQMPAQKVGVVLDPDNTNIPTQLWYYLDDSGERVNVPVLAEWTDKGGVKPLKVWVDRREFSVRASAAQWLAARKDGGDGIRFITQITNRESRVFQKPFVLYFDKCPQTEVWFVEEKER